MDKKSQTKDDPYPELFFLFSLIIRYCTCVKTSFAISETKIFSLALNKWESAIFLYYRFPLDQTSHLEKMLFLMLLLFLFC